MGRPKDPGNMTVNEQAQEILKIARKHGVEQNFFFITTFKRYQVQIKVLNDLEKIIKDEGLIVSKEYVKGRKNVYSHPAIKDYNRTTDSANKTVSVLMKIILSMRPKDDDGDDAADPLLSILQGGGGNDFDLTSEFDDDDEENEDAEDADDEADASDDDDSDDNAK